MGYILSILVALAIVFAAAWILVKRLGAFKRSCGRSACENCPYSGACGGKK